MYQIKNVNIISNITNINQINYLKKVYQAQNITCTKLTMFTKPTTLIYPILKRLQKQKNYYNSQCLQCTLSYWRPQYVIFSVYTKSSMSIMYVYIRLTKSKGQIISFSSYQDTSIFKVWLFFKAQLLFYTLQKKLLLFFNSMVPGPVNVAQKATFIARFRLIFRICCLFGNIFTRVDNSGMCNFF